MWRVGFVFLDDWELLKGFNLGLGSNVVKFGFEGRSVVFC